MRRGPCHHRRNHRPSRPREPRVGDVLILDLEDQHVEAEILQIPSRPVPEKKGGRILSAFLHSERRRRDEILSFDDDQQLP